MAKGLRGSVFAFNGTLSFIISTPNDWNPRVGGICKFSAQLQISNIWQASHVATGKCISRLTALPVASESQLPAAAPVAVFISLTFTNDKFIHAVALSRIVPASRSFPFSPFPWPRKTTQAAKCPEPKSIEREMRH